MRFYTAALLFFRSLSLTTATDEACAPISDLGTPNVDRFDASTSMDIDENCEFTWKLSFKHDKSVPLPSDPPAQCDPSIVPPQIAPDELPYFAFRWFYEKVSEDIKKVTGIDHISIDWNPCGHPPVNVFGMPHYDIHIYLVTPEFRTCMTCTQPPGAPVCTPAPEAQSTARGLDFFNVTTLATTSTVRSAANQPINMPPGFIYGPEHNIPLMGGHAWNHNQEPASGLEWVDPIWLMSPYAGTIINYEPMIPLNFVTGDSDKEFIENLSYEGQTIGALPSMYSVKYDSKTEFTTLTLKGTSNDKSYCEKESYSHDHKSDDDGEESVDSNDGVDGNSIKSESAMTNGVIPSIAFIMASLFF